MLNYARTILLSAAGVSMLFLGVPAFAQHSLMYEQRM